MELDVNVHWPDRWTVGGAGTDGDNVIYSVRPGDVPHQDPGPIRGAQRLRGWYQADAASTFLVQIRTGSTWTTINNAGAGVAVAANDVCVFNERKPAGEFRLVVNFPVAPTATSHSNITLCTDAAQEVTTP
jgi:hypothetical protein